MATVADVSSDDAALQQGRELVDRLRAAGAPLDGRVRTVWFVHGVVRTLLRDVSDPAEIAAQQVGFAVYLADLLATTAQGITVSVETVDGDIAEVTASDSTGRLQNVLSWVRKATAGDPADNVVFKIACALADFGCREQADQLFEDLRALDES